MVSGAEEILDMEIIWKHIMKSWLLPFTHSPTRDLQNYLDNFGTLVVCPAKPTIRISNRLDTVHVPDGV